MSGSCERMGSQLVCCRRRRRGKQWRCRLRERLLLAQLRAIAFDEAAELDVLSV
ncbi:MAG: hypothetical protein RLZZ481_1908 [Pseudomonadota bacterium]|jgi:hypothetical protein